MRPADHLYSELASLQRQFDATKADWEQLAAAAYRLFARLAAPAVGQAVCDDLFAWWKDSRAGTGDTAALAHIAAFLCDGYDPAQTLGKADWLAIKDAVNAEAEDMDLRVLSRIMADLVDRGALDE